MFKISKYFLVGIFVLFGVLLFNPVLAQENNDTTTDTAVDTAPVAELTSEVATNNESVKVPGAWGLFWRNLTERISLAVTFDPIKKAEKMVTFAEDRIQLAEVMSERAGDNLILQNRATEMVRKSNNFMQKVEERKGELLDKTDERTQKILERVGNQMLHREEVIEKMESRLNPEHLENFKQLRQAGLESSQRLLNAISNENIPTKIKEHLEKIKLKNEAHLEEVKTFLVDKKELLQKIQNEDEDAKEELKQLRQERAQGMEERKLKKKEMIQDEKELKKEIKKEVNDEEEESEDLEDKEGVVQTL